MAFILERYVLRHTVLAFLVGLFALTGMIFVGMVGAIMREGFNIVQVRAIIPYLLLYSLPYAVPVALLCAVVFTFGRMSGDNEIMAVRSSGIWPDRLGLPVLAFGLLLSAGTFWLYHWPMPDAHRTVDEQKEKMVRMLITRVGDFQPQFDVPPYQIYVRTRDPGTLEWRDVVIVHLEGEFVKEIIRARSGVCLVSEKEETATIVLKDCVVLRPQAGAEKMPVGAHAEKMTLPPIDLRAKVRRQMTARPMLWRLPELWRRLGELAGQAAKLPPLSHPQSARREADRDRNAVNRRMERAAGRLSEARAARRKAEQDVPLLEADLSSCRQQAAAAAADLSGLETRTAALRDEENSLRAEGRSNPPAPRRKEIEARLAAVEKLGAALAAQQKDLQRRRAAFDRDAARAADGLQQARSRLEAARRHEEQPQREYDGLAVERRDLTARLKAAQTCELFTDAGIEYHSRNASAATCFVFALIGIPLGVICHRGNVIYALAFSFAVIILVYHPLTVVAHLLATDGLVPAGPAFWAPPAVVGALGLALQAFWVRR